ncbi:MAG: hypothetical protein Q9209_005818 [Squamulea sp. 1 TL-2023]
MPFLFLELPLELRNMIYREVVLFNVSDAEMKRRYHAECTMENNEDEVKRLKRNHTKNLQLANRQIKTEASKVQIEERYYQSEVDPMRWSSPKTWEDLDQPLCHLPPFEALPTVHNVEIIIPGAFFGSHYSADCQNYWSVLTTKLLSVLCDDLASQCLRLRNVVVYLPCECAHDHRWIVQHRRGSNWQRCFRADGLAWLLDPIGRIRSRNIRFVHECKSPVIAELQPVFWEFIAMVQSSMPAASLPEKHNDWLALRLEAKRRGQYERIKEDMRQAWMYMDDWLLFPPPGLPEVEWMTFQYNFEKARDNLEACNWNEELMLSVAAPAS